MEILVGIFLNGHNNIVRRINMELNWHSLSQIEKFTPIKNVFESIGAPKFKLGIKPVYYMGRGYLISYTPMKFRVENSKRVEFGDNGEYALNIYFFMLKQELKEYFKINDEKYVFEGETLGEPFEIFDSISINSTYEEVINILRPKSTLAYYQDGETKVMKNGVFEFQNNFVIWSNFNFLFYGKSKKTKLSAFQFTLDKSGIK